MKKHILVLLLMVLVVCTLTACVCKHDWMNATCTDPLTCSKCGKTMGTAQGHTIKEATCTEDKHCVVCQYVEEETPGHTWQDATCTKAKFCTVCGVTEGQAAGHSWGKATCTTPRTCSRCGATEGEPKNHKWSDINAEEPQSCVECGVLRSSLIKHPEHQELAQAAADLLDEYILRNATTLTLKTGYGAYRRDEDTGAKTDQILVILQVSAKNAIGSTPTEYMFAWYNDAGYLAYMISPEMDPKLYADEFVLEYLPELPEID